MFSDQDVNFDCRKKCLFHFVNLKKVRSFECAPESFENYFLMLFKSMMNNNPAVLNIIESYFLHQTEVDIKAMSHACKTVIKTTIYFSPITTLDRKNLDKNN